MNTAKKNVVLIGMRGAGKSSVGVILATQLQLELIEMDALIVDEARMSIPQIVEKYGWEHFRAIEARVTEQVSRREGTVNSTGGGVILNPQNVQVLQRHGIVFWLDVSTDNILQRINEDPNRPSLTEKASLREEIETVLTQRAELYYRAADEVIDTNGKLPEQVAEEILQLLQTEYRLEVAQ